MAEFKHTDAAEMELFLGKPQSAQLLEIWLNGRETNGSVAQVERELALQGREIQQARLDLSNHLQEHHDQQTGIDFIKVWGARGTAFLALLISIATLIVIAHQGGWHP